MWIILIIWLFILSIYLSIKLKFSNYKLNIKDLLKKDKSGLFLSLATKIGVGSIIGTVSSIIIGGFSSILWMTLFSFLTTSLIYYESLLGSKYKQKYKDNYISGPYFILKFGLNKKLISLIALLILIILYSFLFQMVQVNTISNSIYNILYIDKKIIFIFIIILLMLTTCLNIKDTTNLINKIVPFKCILFIIICLFGIVTHFSELISAFNILIKNLLTFKSIMSGLIIGIKRSIFMNEILIGTSSISSGSDNNDLITSTRYQILGVYFISFVLTLLVTCLIMIYFNNHYMISDYNKLITNIFLYTNGKLGAYLIIVIFILFGFTTLLSGYYILNTNISYLFNSKIINLLSKILFILIVSLGTILDTSTIWKYTDILIFIMIIINSYSIIKLIRK